VKESFIERQVRSKILIQKGGRIKKKENLRRGFEEAKKMGKIGKKCSQTKIRIRDWGGWGVVKKRLERKLKVKRDLEDGGGPDGGKRTLGRCGSYPSRKRNFGSITLTVKKKVRVSTKDKEGSVIGKQT